MYVMITCLPEEFHNVQEFQSLHSSSYSQDIARFMRKNAENA